MLVVPSSGWYYKGFSMAGPLDFGGWMSRYRMRLCRACFGIRANFPFIPFNTIYLTTNNNFYLIHSFFYL